MIRTTLLDNGSVTLEVARPVGKLYDLSARSMPLPNQFFKGELVFVAPVGQSEYIGMITEIHERCTGALTESNTEWGWYQTDYRVSPLFALDKRRSVGWKQILINEQALLTANPRPNPFMAWLLFQGQKAVIDIHRIMQLIELIQQPIFHFLSVLNEKGYRDAVVYLRRAHQQANLYFHQRIRPSSQEMLLNVYHSANSFMGAELERILQDGDVILGDKTSEIQNHINLGLGQVRIQAINNLLAVLPNIDTHRDNVWMTAATLEGDEALSLWNQYLGENIEEEAENPTHLRATPIDLNSSNIEAMSEQFALEAGSYVFMNDRLFRVLEDGSLDPVDLNKGTIVGQDGKAFFLENGLSAKEVTFLRGDGSLGDASFLLEDRDDDNMGIEEKSRFNDSAFHSFVAGLNWSSNSSLDGSDDEDFPNNEDEGEGEL